MIKLLSELKKIKKINLFLSFCLVASSIVVIPHGQEFYYMGIILLLCILLSMYKCRSQKSIPYILLLFECALSSMVNLIFDYRLLAFALVIVICSPILYSEQIVKFREKYLMYSLMSFPILMIAALYCYFKGINCFVMADGSIGSFMDFSAFFPHPMWLAACCGLSNVVLAWLLFFSKNSFLGKCLCGLLLLMSVYLSVVSASRSALVASLLSIIVFSFFKAGSIVKIIRVSVIASVVVLLTLPYYINSSERMQEKFDGSEGKYGSRTAIVEVGLKHFEDTFIFGTGFAASYSAENKLVVGRMESGSGWLSIMLQTGLIGLFIVLYIVNKSVKAILPYLRKDEKLQLFFFTFLFLCLHSVFEGYILTVGYYLCILFWMLLGYLSTYKDYIKTHTVTG